MPCVCALGGAFLDAEQCCRGCAGGAGVAHPRVPCWFHAGGWPGAAVAGVAFCCGSCCCSNLGKLQVRSLQGCGMLCGWVLLEPARVQVPIEAAVVMDLGRGVCPSPLSEHPQNHQVPTSGCKSGLKEENDVDT